MSSEITIRIVSAEDWQSFRDIRLESLRLAPSAYSTHHDDQALFTEADWRKRLDGQVGPVFLAFDGATPVGMMALIPTIMRNAKHRATLGGVYVQEKYRGSGLAKRMLEAVHLEAKSRGISMIEITVNRSNLRADKFYVGQGYTDIGVMKNALLVDGQWFDEIFMYKEL